MGSIRETATAQMQTLEWEHLIGRAGPPKCSLTLDAPHVSGVHAVLRWTGHDWELKDQGSRNGTYLDGVRLDPGAIRAVRKGCRIGFGLPEQEWEIVDESAPGVMVVPLDGGEPRMLEGEMVALPSSDDPQVTVYRRSDGAWVLEHAQHSRVTVLGNGQTFQAAGGLWRFCCPTTAVSTLDVPKRDRRIEVASLHLTLSVSQNEEYVHLRATHPGGDIDMGASVYFYLLVTLARRRLADAASGLPDSSCGWIDYEELSADPMMAVPQLNLAVHRVRHQFMKAGITNGATIIERRQGLHLLRIGTADLSVVRI